MAEQQPRSVEPGFKNRRHSRELALQTLYACEVGTSPDWEVMLGRIADGGSFADEYRAYARDLVREALSHLETIDATISKHAANWELKRMAALDRNVLRMAVTELFYFSEVPFKVVIDEAVELAKSYGTDESGKFVNGVLDSIHKDHRENGIAG